jgi:hypothetical protein
VREDVPALDPEDLAEGDYVGLALEGVEVREMDPLGTQAVLAPRDAPVQPLGRLPSVELEIERIRAEVVDRTAGEKRMGRVRAALGDDDELAILIEAGLGQVVCDGDGV